MPLLGSGDRVDQPLDDRVGVDALRRRVEVGHDPVPQDRLGERLDVLDRHVIPPVHQRARLRAADERLAGAQAGAPLHPLLDEVRRAGIAGPRRLRQPHRVARDLLGDHHLSHQLLKLQDVVARQNALRRWTVISRRPRDHGHFIVFTQVLDDDVEHEAIELGLGQRIGALELDRILRREHEERTLERIGPAGGGDVVLLHRLEQRRLRLRRRAVDLVGEDDLREDRPLHEPQPARAPFFVEDLGAGDVRRHQIRRELDPLEVEMQDVGERLDEERLGQTGHAGDQTMTAGEERNQHLLDHFVLADDDLAQLGENARAALRDFLDAHRGFQRPLREINNDDVRPRCNHENTKAPKKTRYTDVFVTSCSRGCI